MENTYREPENITMLNPKKIKVIKAKARENLLGNYGPIIGATILIAVITSIVSTCFSSLLNQPAIFQHIIFYIADFIITMLVNFFYTGIYVMHLKATRGEKGTLADLAYPVKNGSNQFLIVSAVLAVISYLQSIPMILLINQFDLEVMIMGSYESLDLPKIYLLTAIVILTSIISLILMLTFVLSQFFLIDNPDMTAKDALLSSQHYMKGNKLRLLFLYISFIGMYLLGILTAGIAYLWLTPYMYQSVTVLYKTLVEPRQ